VWSRKPLPIKYGTVITCLRCILGHIRLEIGRKIGLSGYWCLCTVLCTRVLVHATFGLARMTKCRCLWHSASTQAGKLVSVRAWARRASQCPIKVADKSCWFSAWEHSLNYPTLYLKEMRVPSKIRVLPSEIFAQTLGFENFTGDSIMCALSAKFADGWACIERTHNNRRVMAGGMHMVHYTSVHCNPLIPILLHVVLQFVVYMFTQLWSSWQDFDWHNTLHGLSAVTELLVQWYLGTARSVVIF